MPDFSEAFDSYVTIIDYVLPMILAVDLTFH